MPFIGVPFAYFLVYILLLNGVGFIHNPFSFYSDIVCTKILYLLVYTCPLCRELESQIIQFAAGLHALKLEQGDKVSRGFCISTHTGSTPFATHVHRYCAWQGPPFKPRDDCKLSQ